MRWGDWFEWVGWGCADFYMSDHGGGKLTMDASDNRNWYGVNLYGRLGQ